MKFMIRTSGMQYELMSRDVMELADEVLLIMRTLHNVPEDIKTTLQYDSNVFNSNQEGFVPGTIKAFKMHLIDTDNTIPPCVHPDAHVESYMAYNLFIVCAE